MNTTNIIITTDEPVAAAVTDANTTTANSNYDDNDNDEGDDDGSSIILDGSNSSEIVVVDIDVSPATAAAFSTSTSTTSANSTSPTPVLQAVQKIHIQRGGDDGQQQQQKLVPISPGAAGVGASSTSTSADATSPTPTIPTPPPTPTSPTPPSTSSTPPPPPPILIVDNPPSLQAVKKIHIQRGSNDDDEHDGHDGHDRQQQQQQQQVPIISLNECIYGRREETNDDDDNDNDKHGNEATTEDNTATTVIPTSSHSRHRRHDIDISILRKLSSTNGSSSSSSSSTDDPNDHLRGVMWRLLLGQLPTTDIYNTWSTTLTTQRNLYQELISTYLNCSNDTPTFNNNISEKYQNQTQTQQQQQHSTRTSIQTNQQDQEQELLDASLDLSSICCPPTIQTTTKDNNEDNVNDNDNENWCNASRYQESMYICLDEDIYNEFPDNSKYKELWKQSGITLNKGQSASSIGMNILQIPKELLLVTTDNDDDDDDDDNEDDDHEILKSSIISTSTRNDKLFNQFIRDAKTLMEIRKDVVRTHPTLQFYTEPKDNLGIRRHAAIERILFIWAKLNGNLYVQGMNEIVGTMYYVLANDKSKYPMNNSNSNNNNTSSSDDYWSIYAEYDTYYLFHNLMLVDDIRDVYHQDLDHESNPTGLHGRISNIELLIKKHDPILYKHLIQNLNIDTSFYTIRWLTTLLSREFLLNDTIRLWDSMFSSTNKENFLRYFCATMVIHIRSKLLCGDFGTCLKLLQNYPSKPGDGDGDGGDAPSSSISSIVATLLESSRSLWIYESQITLACHKGGLSLNDALQMIKPPINKSNNDNGNRNGTIIMAYGLPGGIYDVSSTSTIIENASTVTGQVLDVLSTTAAAATATVAASARITAVVPMQKNVSRMFGKAKSIFKNRYNNTSTNSNNNNNNAAAAAAATNNNNSVDDDDNNNDNDGTAATTTNATSIIDDGWDIIDSIIGGNNEYLQHRRLIEDSTTTTTTSIGLVGVGVGDDDNDDDDNRDCIRISQLSSPISALGARTTTTASTSISDIGIGGPVLLTNAKNRLWNRISGTPTAATAAATTSTSFPTNDSTITTNTTAANPINSKNDRFWNRRGGGSSGGR